MERPLCSCGERYVERQHSKTAGKYRQSGYRKLCWKCRIYHPNPEKYKQSRRDQKRLLKIETLKHYGGVCVCCGESNLLFLTIDHINGNGGQHRRQLGMGNGGGHVFYQWLKNNHFPNGYQVLCFNCNCGRAINNGVCPHEQSHIIISE